MNSTGLSCPSSYVYPDAEGKYRTMERSNPKEWVALLRPHRSLSSTGYVTVMTLIAAMNGVVGGVFLAMGAWPVLGFAGFDVFLLWWAFRASFAAGQAAERIRITDHELVLERLRRGGPPERQCFMRCWVRIELEEDAARERIGRLSLVSRDRRIPIGDFLAPEERKSLAAALRAAIAVSRI
jgi:uncharacterized membrane protein